jgi:putative transposase
MVASPAEYQWSSFRANACGATDELIEPHAVYRQLGGCAETRKLAYRELFGSPIADDDLRVIRDATQNAWALGSAAIFRKKIAALNRRGERLPLGRPRKQRRDPLETPL